MIPTPVFGAVRYTRSTPVEERQTAFFCVSEDLTVGLSLYSSLVAAFLGRTPYAQAAAWDGYHRCHGFNNQAITYPNGLIGMMAGPYFSNDLYMLDATKTIAVLERLSRALGALVCVYGDRGYSHGNPVLQVPYGYSNRTRRQKLYDRLMSKARVTVEWCGGRRSRIPP